MSVWKPVGTGIWVGEYDFRGNGINTSLVQLASGGLMAISPGAGMSEEDYAAAGDIGSIEALVVPGAYHNMGLPPWHERFGAAAIYGPEDSIAHIAKQHPGLAAVQPLSALTPLLKAGDIVEAVGGMRNADLFLATRRDDAVTWFTNEVITNMASYPGNFLFKLAFQLTGSGPGLNVNKLSMMLCGGKKQPVRAYYETKLASIPPTRLVPTHGGVIDDPGLAARLGEVIARRL